MTVATTKGNTVTDTDQLSIQLYTLRSMGEVDRVLDAVAEAGYRHVEAVGGHLEDAAGLRAKLDSRGLHTSSSHVSIAALREKPEAILEACRTLGFEDLFMPSVPPAERQSGADYWRSLGAELGALSERFEREGVRLGYHNHNWELTPKEGGRNALELLFEAAGSSPLRWQADLAWLIRGGADPADWMARYRDRLTSVHVKDLAPEGQNAEEDGWADVGSGVMDWPTLWRTARENGARWMVVEHDKPADPAASVRNSFRFISGMKG
ncbi:sugar phosphate isomerase/epimerase family protein [Roseomonas elaeocarpi]|uniref:Sugar phosphate isomerase/epimerase family protein n=1 Tax=Roseomonas elaeocarpi TaxID=907779 RepID=A0ABV6JRD3_9PROT